MRYWAIKRGNETTFHTTADNHTPQDEGIPVEVNDLVYEVTRYPVMYEYFDWSTHTYQFDLPLMTVQLQKKVERERDQYQAPIIEETLDYSVESALKTAEVRDFRKCSTLTILTMPVIARRKRWPYITAEATALGQTIYQVADAFETELAAGDNVVRTIAVKARKAKAAIRNATTAEAKLAAANVDWSIT